MRKLLPFDANAYASLTTDDAPFEAMSHVRGASSKVTIKKQTRDDRVMCFFFQETVPCDVDSG